MHATSSTYCYTYRLVAVCTRGLNNSTATGVFPFESDVPQSKTDLKSGSISFLSKFLQQWDVLKRIHHRASKENFWIKADSTSQGHALKKVLFIHSHCSQMWLLSVVVFVETAKDVAGFYKTIFGMYIHSFLQYLIQWLLENYRQWSQKCDCAMF